MASRDEFVQRNFREGDLPQIIAFRRKAVKTSFPGRRLDEKRFSARLVKAVKSDNESVMVLENGGELVGYAWFGMREGDVGKYGFLRQIFIREDFRKRGLAQKLLQRAEKQLASQGAKSVRLTVTSSNCPACAFYEKMNYKKTRLLMEKKL